MMALVYLKQVKSADRQQSGVLKNEIKNTRVLLMVTFDLSPAVALKCWHVFVSPWRPSEVMTTQPSSDRTFPD